MSNHYYKYAYLYWLIPLFFLGLAVHQTAVRQGLKNTYKEGTSYTAEILQFETKQIVTQNSSFVVLEFETKSGKVIREKLSLPVEISGTVSKGKILPIRYDPDSFQDIIIIAAYEDHKSVTLVNIAMAAFAFLATAILGWGVNRWVRSQNKPNKKQKLIITNIKTADS